MSVCVCLCVPIWTYANVCMHLIDEKVVFRGIIECVVFEIGCSVNELIERVKVPFSLLLKNDAGFLQQIITDMASCQCQQQNGKWKESFEIMKISLKDDGFYQIVWQPSSAPFHGRQVLCHYVRAVILPIVFLSQFWISSVMFLACLRLSCLSATISSLICLHLCQNLSGRHVSFLSIVSHFCYHVKA